MAGTFLLYCSFDLNQFPLYKGIVGNTVGMILG